MEPEIFTSMAEEKPNSRPQTQESAVSMQDIAFTLSEDEIKKIRYLGKLEKRKSRKTKDNKKPVGQKFSDKLSLEAQIAMQLAFKDTQEMKSKSTDIQEDPENIRHKSNHVKFADDPLLRPETACTKYTTYSEAYEKRDSLRMECDLTDDNFDLSSVKKRSLDGMKVQNTMEMIEIVNSDDPNYVDDDVIEQIAKRNSVEKCLVWMEVTGQEGNSQTQGSPSGFSPKGKGHIRKSYDKKSRKNYSREFQQE